jgi:hypothetical protein
LQVVLKFGLRSPKPQTERTLTRLNYQWHEKRSSWSEPRRSSPRVQVWSVLNKLVGRKDDEMKSRVVLRVQALYTPGDTTERTLLQLLAWEWRSQRGSNVTLFDSPGDPLRLRVMNETVRSSCTKAPVRDSEVRRANTARWFTLPLLLRPQRIQEPNRRTQRQTTGSAAHCQRFAPNNGRCRTQHTQLGRRGPSCFPPG